ncbi:MAG: tRNA (adenosine(37)-N6)-threonylcarbamoyltransferase complex dimerization subunit type 1 TsaB [Saprospiraceae bacterium]|nr:tRNA (adenosine(37)-N6)-threonylcarbamoyltransferase complex dimerization subunit type 1 TsaB [Saprospiraceae bacterium]
MAKILLLETATEVCSAAIGVDGKVAALAEVPRAESHSAVLTRLIDECVHTAGITLDALDAVAVSAGPGAYTSLRVGVSTAQGICYALSKPLIAVDTLYSLAAASRAAPGNHAGDIYLPMIDARRQEVWMAAYDHQLQLLRSAGPVILENNLFELYLRDLPGYDKVERFVLSGNGGKKIENVPKVERTVLAPVVSCSASFMADTAERLFKNNDFQDVAYFTPVYMKPPNITQPAKSIL